MKAHCRESDRRAAEKPEKPQEPAEEPADVVGSFPGLTDGVIQLGVVGASDEWLAHLREVLGDGIRRRWELTAVSALASILPPEPGELQWDVALAFLSARSLGPLTDILTMHDRLGFPEIVAIAENPHDAAAAALREFGVDRVLSQDVAIPWLSETVGPLADIALAKRLLRRCRKIIREPPRVDPFAGPEFLPLTVAEARFREAYLRALMARVGSRALAAKGAGVPYRTLCYMLERYGIGAPDGLQRS